VRTVPPKTTDQETTMSDETTEKQGVTRRRVLGLAAGTGAGVVLANGPLRLVPGTAEEEALAAGACIMTPAKEIGPYFVEEKLNRSNIVDGQSGTPLALTMYVFDYANGCAAVSGAQVDVWHANALGKYSDEASEGTTGQTWLRGFQTTDSTGKVAFTTIFPGFYSGRTVHIHVRVRVGSLDFITQLFFDEAQTAAVMATAPYSSNTTNGTRVPNTSDRVYTTGSNGSQLLVTLSGAAGSGFTGEFSAGTGGSSSTGTTTTDKVVSIALSAIRVARAKHGKRTLRLRFKVKETVYVTPKLTRGKKTLAKRTGVKLTGGTHVLKVAVPRKYGAGAAKLAVKVIDTKGNTKRYSRAVHVPKKLS
jgi:protocatechuate 3,4-dioxygenase beta subunit